MSLAQPCAFMNPLVGKVAEAVMASLMPSSLGAG